MNGPDVATTIAKRKNKMKKQTLVSDTASSASSNNCCSTTSSTQKGVKLSRNHKRIRVGPLGSTRKSVRSSDVDALGLPLGISTAVLIAQVLEMKNCDRENMSLDYLCQIGVLAVRRSLGNVFGNKCDNFMRNFEESFRITLMASRSVSDVSQNVEEQSQRSVFRGCCCSTLCNLLSEKLEASSCRMHTDERAEIRNDLSGSIDRVRDYSCIESLPRRNNTEQQERAENGDRPFALASIVESRNSLNDFTCSSGDRDFSNQQLVPHDKQKLACTSASNHAIDQYSMMEKKSLVEQTRSDGLKSLEVGLTMKNLEFKERELELKERELELHSDANNLERLKLSMGVSKVSFKVKKFKTQVQDSGQHELLKKCLDCLVAGLIIMLSSLGYGTYVYSHRRIIEATEACSPYTESKAWTSWWMPSSVSTFNSGLQLLKCQVQVFSRMLFGVLLISAIVFLLIQRSAASHHTMPVTFILLLLGAVCGYAGKFCVDTLGGSGNHWLIYWETLCVLHFIINAFHSTFFFILSGPIAVTERVECNTAIPYWMRRWTFYGTLLLLPLFCGFMPFATPRQWLDHFLGWGSDFDTYVD